ncbi:glycosyltransferase family 4 protein [Bacillus sp. WLY-B-L8]|uniref:glycosyltransferase family 4 protein n=1 Tax=Bacillus multifaciens TaxID=3068506 RepID=UPI00274262ED|nr:glycosyltransferase family 4 protein [Bacillus sp. WLY-B-L8]MDP7979571.1 glycosyltransferase family 4 protein [Bacillus sp. WLY-B-L8]
MPKKVLFCATVDYHFKAFHLPYMKWFAEQGWEVHVAASGNMHLPYVHKKYDIPIQRSPFKLQNFEAYKKLSSIINKNKYSIIHCHTPMGGVLARLAARKARRQGTKVIYTAHGFHFCKGAPLINWLAYYPIERGLASYTDCLITINTEDYNLAVKHRFKANCIEHVHGIGVDTKQFKLVQEEYKQDLKMKFGYKPNDFLMFYAAEFNTNKNQQFLLHSLALLKDEAPNAKLLLAGNGPLMEDCKNLAIELGIAEMVHFLGYRTDIAKLLPICDVAVASSLREGLPVNIMEAMACGLPVIATYNRGHRELIMDTINGYLVSPTEVELFASRILECIHSRALREKIGIENVNGVKKYSIDQVSNELNNIYTQYMLRDVDETKNKCDSSYI